MTSFLRWLFDPANAVQVSAWGLLLGVLGTILTVAGFALTGWQLWKTADATRAAAQAVANIKSRVATYDAVFEISRATSALKETDRHLKKRSWPDAVESYASFRHAVVRLIELPSSLGDEQREELRKMLRSATSSADRLERSVVGSSDPGGVVRAISNNMKAVEYLAVVSIHLERIQ